MIKDPLVVFGNRKAPAASLLNVVLEAQPIQLDKESKR
jgi:hypothetical protein